MRRLIASALTTMLLTGCGLAERFSSPEERINAAVPPGSGVQAAHQRLTLQVADQPEEKKALEAAWSTRLRLRALSCSRDFAPSWRDSAADVRARLTNTDCFQGADRELQRWVGLQRVRLMLGQDLVRPQPQELPKTISRTDYVSTLVTARNAPVALLRGSSGFEIVDLGTGKDLFKEPSTSGAFTSMALSPNGRLFSTVMSGKVVMRASEGGETLVELLQADDVYWLDADNVVALRNSSGLRLLDLSSGDESPIPVSGSSHSNMVAPVPGQPNRYNFFVHRGVDQVEISRSSGRVEARLVAEKRTESGLGFAVNTGGMSADGKLWMDGHQGLRIIKLDTLEMQEISLGPVGSQGAWPTANPDEFIVALALPTGDGYTSQISYYVYNHRASTLALVDREKGSGVRYQYVPSVKRLALIDNKNIRFIDKVATAEPKPGDQVMSALIDEANQRRLAAAMTAGQPSVSGSASAAAAAAANAVTAAAAAVGTPRQPAPLQEALRDAQIEGVGVYEGAGAKHGGGQQRAAGTVEVKVRRSSRPVALVLSSYEPVRWAIVTEPGARLAAVLVGGYYESTVTGNGSARVYQIGRTYAYEQQGQGYAELQRSVLQWTGKPIGIFQARYAGSSFSVGGGN